LQAKLQCSSMQRRRVDILVHQVVRSRLVSSVLTPGALRSMVSTYWDPGRGSWLTKLLQLNHSSSLDLQPHCHSLLQHIFFTFPSFPSSRILLTMNSFKNKVKSLVGKKTQTQEVAKVGEAGESETAQDALVPVKQPSELAPVPVASTSTA
jgi:hypothetical protein